MVEGALENAVNYSSFKYFITRLFRFTQLHFAFLYLDRNGDDRCDMAEYMTGRRKFRAALDLPLNGDHDKHEMQEEFYDMSGGDDVFGWSRITVWYKDALAKGLVAGESNSIAHEAGGAAEAEMTLINRVSDTVHEPGACLDLDSFCDLVLYCHYHTRSLVKTSQYKAYAVLPSIG